jgi:hypothetical protein
MTIFNGFQIWNPSCIWIPSAPLSLKCPTFYIYIYMYTHSIIYIHIFSHYNVRCHHQSKIWWDEKWTDNCHWQLKLIIFRGLIYIYYIYIYMYIYIIVKYLYIMSIPNE